MKSTISKRLLGLALATSLSLVPSISVAGSFNPAKLNGWKVKKVFKGYEATCPASRCGSEIEAMYSTQRMSRLEARWFDDPNSAYSKNAERMFKGMFGVMSFSPMKFDLNNSLKRTKIMGMPGYTANFTVTVRGTDVTVYASMAMFSDGKMIHSFGGLGQTPAAAAKGRKAALAAWQK